MMNQDAKQEMPAPASKEGAPKGEGMESTDKAAKVVEGVSQRAVELMNGMQEIGFVLSELGVPEDQLGKMAEQFNGFLQTVQSILGAGEGQPEMQGESPAQEGIPYDQGMASAGKNKARPMVG